MADKKLFEGLKAAAKKGVANIDADALKDKALKASSTIAEKAGDLKDLAVETKADVQEKLTEMDRMLDEATTEYNDSYTLMNDAGIQLFVERSRAVDTIQFVEALINSIVNRPKIFDSDFEEIRMERGKFIDSCAFAEQEIKAAREAAAGAGAGLAAGASVAFMAPTAAMWVATTFGTASTGAAISTLSGAAASNAALAWLGGGALAAGGKGMVAGKALLALAGPVGWSIAGATLLGSVVLLSKNKMKTNKQKGEEIEAIKKNTETLKEQSKQIEELLKATTLIREGINQKVFQAMDCYNADFTLLPSDKQNLLASLVTDTRTLSEKLGITFEMNEETNAEEE